MKTKKLILVLAALGLFFLQANNLKAQSEEISSVKLSEKIGNFNESNDLAGAWMATVYPDGAPSFKGLITFDKGGGLTASAQGDVLLNAPPGIPPVATAADGAWERVGNRQYLFTLRQIFYDADGNFQGGAKIRNLGTLNSKGNVLNAQMQFEWFDAGGSVVFSGSGTMQATRIQAEPLTP